MKDTKPKRPRLDWATLHRRTFGMDVRPCPCGGRRTVRRLHLGRKRAEARLAELASREPLKSRARGLFHWLSSRRKDLSRQLRLQPESHIAQVVDAATHEPGAATSEEGGCAMPLPRRSALSEP